MRTWQVVIIVLLSLTVAPSVARGDVSLQGLGPAHVNGQDYHDLYPSGISADGSVIVGTVGLPGNGVPLFRWTAATGAVALTDAVGNPIVGKGVDVSYDGTTMAGSMSTSSGWRPFIMAAGGTPTVLSLPGGATGPGTVWISADGSLVGSAANGAGNHYWSTATGWQIEHYLRGPGATSADFTASASYLGWWTAAGGFVPLAGMPPDMYAFGPQVIISGDGTTSAGEGNWSSPPNGAGFIWHAGTDFEPMTVPAGPLSGFLFPTDISHDVTVVVGTMAADGTPFFWTEEGDLFWLESFLEDNGVDVLSLFPDGLDHISPTTLLVSADGTTVTGEAHFGTGAYVATIPEPATVCLLGLGLGGLLLRRKR